MKKIRYQNSGDVTQDKSRVVGYVSIVGTSKDLVFRKISLDTNLQKEALNIARQTLSYYLKDGFVPNVEISSPIFNESAGVFVTLYENGELRGCIGTFEPAEPFYKVIQNTAILSATKDTRFSPVKFEELGKIEIEISIMTPRKEVNDWKDIKLGSEGVVLQEGLRSGTFLPQVASDNNWGLEKFLSELCSQKAGLNTDCYKDPQVNIYSFEVNSFREK